MLLFNAVPNMFCLLCLALQDIWWHHNDLSRLLRKVLLAFQWFIACCSWLPSHLSTFYFALYKTVSCITDVHGHESLNKYNILFLLGFCLQFQGPKANLLSPVVDTWVVWLTRGKKNYKCCSTHLARAKGEVLLLQISNPWFIWIM